MCSPTRPESSIGGSDERTLDPAVKEGSPFPAADSRYHPMPTSSQSMHDILGSSDSKPPLPPQGSMRRGGGGGGGGGINTSQSHYVLNVPESPSRRTASLRKNQKLASNSINTFSTPIVTDTSSSEDAEINHLNAEPYLKPLEVKQMLRTLSPLLDTSDSNKFLSVRESKPTSRPPLPMQHSAGVISGTLRLTRQSSLNKSGHRRTASNPWVLEGKRGGEGSFFPLPPPVPPRGFPKYRSRKSPPSPAHEGGRMLESSLDFSLSNRRSVASAVTSPAHNTPTHSNYEDIDNVSMISGPFEEISDNLDSPVPRSITPNLIEARSPSSTATAQPQVASDYEKIEDYITMGPSAAFLAKKEVAKSREKSKSPKPKQKTSTMPKSSSKDKIKTAIPNAAPTSPTLLSRRHFSSTLDTRHQPKKATTVSSIRPLPPSPIKGVKGIKRLNSSDSNIYETIDEELLNQIRPRTRRKSSNLFHWVPPVAPQHQMQYMVILRKFFTTPDVQALWLKTVQDVVPEDYVKSFPLPFSKNKEKESDKKDFSPSEEKEAEEVGDRKPSPKESPVSAPRSIVQSRHLKQDSNDQYILVQPRTTFTATGTTTLPLHTQNDNGGGSRGASPLPGMKKLKSQEDLIEMLNWRAFEQGYSSESDTSNSEASDSEAESEEGGEEREEEGEEDGQGEGEREGEGEEGRDGGGGERGGETGDEEGQIEAKDDEAAQKENVEENGENEEIDEDIRSAGHATTSRTKTDSNDLKLASSSTSGPQLDTYDSNSALLQASESTDSAFSSPAKPSYKSERKEGSQTIITTCTLYNTNTPQEDIELNSDTVLKRASPKRKIADMGTKNLSDSGISNCHSQVYEDGIDNC